MLRRNFLPLSATAFLQAQEYKYGPDSERHPGVPQGKVTKFTWKSAKLFPGTERDYWVYVPAQYDASKPAAVMVIQDGGGFVSETGAWRAPVVFDNLIAKGEMPVTIGILINPGVMPARNSSEQARYNRSFEYDALGDRYARFLIEEILPEVGKSYNLTADPNLRAIAGSSSGAIAAFTAAWERPDAFRRVLSYVGSYTNLRGGQAYSSLTRKTEGKPLRVYLQDGRNDQNIFSGSWFIGNQDMAAALDYAGYQTTFVIGSEGHNSKHGGPIFPDSLRWLWQNWNKPIPKARTAKGERRYVDEILHPDFDWEIVSRNHRFTEGPAVDKNGDVFFSDIPNNRIHKIEHATGKVSVFREDTGGSNGLMFGPDGMLYACQNGRKRIVSYDASGKETVIAEGAGSNDIAVSAKGDIWFTDPGDKRVWHIDAKRNRKIVIEKTLEFPNGIRLSPDQSLLLVADMRNKWIWSYQIQPDGSLANGQAFYRLETPDENSQSGADGMTVGEDGHLYVATSLGIQICDQPGRVVGIINKPEAKWMANVVFGGPELDTLYVTLSDKVYRRKIRRKGFFPWVVVKPPQPRL